jgi:hypothetical protein
VHATEVNFDRLVQLHNGQNRQVPARLGPMTPQVKHVFVYGTLRPGDVRWQFLEPFVVDGQDDLIDGRLFVPDSTTPLCTARRARRARRGDPRPRTYALIVTPTCLQEVLDREGTVVALPEDHHRIRTRVWNYLQRVRWRARPRPDRAVLVHPRRVAETGG